MGVNNETLYLKIEQNTIVYDRHVVLNDIAKMECTNEAVLRQLKQKKIYSFTNQKDEKKEKNQMQVFSVLKIFGSAFTIMAFNNDISVTDVFDKLYGQVTGTKADGVNELEVCYCIGLGLGIILFFNHVGRKKITPDPTPIQIEMRKYETDLDTAFINNAERRGHSVDVD